MSVEQYYNDTERANWSIGRKLLFSVGGKWMNVLGAVVEDTDVGNLKYREKKIIVWLVDKWMCM